MIKKYLVTALVTCVLCMTSLVGCGKKVEDVSGVDIVTLEDKKDGAFNIVCTGFHQYDWTREILGEHTDKFNLTLILNDNNSNYEPTDNVIDLFAEADIIIYNGTESDTWVTDILSQSAKETATIINLTEITPEGVLAEEMKDGMEDKHSDLCNKMDDENMHLSFINVRKYVEDIYTAISDLEYDIEHEINYLNYCTELNNLEAEYANIVSCSMKQPLIVADNFKLSYFAQNMYDLNYYAALPSCVDTNEVSDETIQFLAKQLDGLEVRVILVNEDSDMDIANKINEATINKDCEILVFDTITSVTVEDIENGYTYLDAFRSNIDNIKKALLYAP